MVRGSTRQSLGPSSPSRRTIGLSRGVFNTFGNLAAITTPSVLGYLVTRADWFDVALVFVAANALLAVFLPVVVVGRGDRIELGQPQPVAVNE